MSTLINATKIALLLLCAAGYYGTWHILLNNGTTKYMSDIRDVGPQVLPGTNEPLKTVYVGIPQIDYQLSVLTLFFWELVDGSKPSASLFSFHFATQVACGWGVLVIEGLRPVHRWRIISFIGTIGVFVQSAAYAVVVPIYLIVYLSTSPLVAPRQVADFLPQSHVVAAVPLSIGLGYVLPAILMSLPAPSVITFEQKQTFIATWQAFPLWVAGFQAILPYFMKALMSGRAAPSTTSFVLKRTALRQVYSVLLVFAGVGHISTLTLLATSKLFTGLFTPNFRGIFNPSKVFVPLATSPATKMPSIGSGAFILLQYDQMIGSMSMALFATIMYIRAAQQAKSTHDIGVFVVWGLAIATITGPSGYVVACIWARDELISQAEGIDTKKWE